MHSRFNSWSNIHLLSIIEAFLSGAVCMSLVWISKAVVSHSDEEAMSLSVLYKINRNCGSSCHCRSFNQSSCCLSPFYPLMDTWRARHRHPPQPLIPRSARLPPPLIWRSGLATVISLMLLFLGQVTCQNFTLTWPHYIQYFLPILLLLLWLQFLLSRITGLWDLSTELTELFMLFSQMTCLRNTFALSPCSERLEHANVTQSHCLSLSVKNKSIWSTFR